jgi:hypothetical protein
LTWLAVLLWLYDPFLLNLPHFESYTVDPVTGELSEPTRYKSLSELPFPVGWPLHYVKPSYLTTPAAPVLVGTALPPPAPSTVHPFALVTNVVLVLIAISSLIYVLQKTRYRFSLSFLFGVMMAVPLYFGAGRLIAMLAGYNVAQWYPIAVYFSPIPAVLVVRYSMFPRLNWLSVRSIWKRRHESFDGYSNADDAIAAASRLEMLGDWTDSIDLYRFAAERWPEQREYVQRCIDRIAEKQLLAPAVNRQRTEIG